MIASERAHLNHAPQKTPRAVKPCGSRSTPTADARSVSYGALSARLPFANREATFAQEDIVQSRWAFSPCADDGVCAHMIL